MISKSLSTSERWSSLHREAGKLAEFCQVLFTLLVTHADDHGRLEGSAFTVKHLVVPTSPRRESDVAMALGFLDHVGLIHWYEGDSGSGGTARYIQISQFQNHQSLKGHEDRPSKYPDPPARAQNRPESPKPPLTKEKLSLSLTEENLPSAVPALMAHYHDGYLQRFGEKPNISGAKDGALLKTLVKLHGVDAVRNRITQMLDSTDAFIVGSGRTIGILSSLWNKLGGPKTPQNTRLRGCRHEPACKEPAVCTKKNLAASRGAA